MRGKSIPYYLLLSWLVILASCAKEYSIEGLQHSEGYLVKDANNDCSLITVSGTYVLGHLLSDSNYLQVQVHVGKTGRYTITSPDINGYSFSARGQFADTGIVQVTLAGSGKPITPGTDIFTIQYDSSFCQAAITVQDTLPNVVLTTNPDHFPLADENKWSYDDLTFPGDSVVRSTTGTVTQNGTPHWKMNDYISFYPANNARYFLRTGNNYLQYSDVSSFTSYVEFSPTIYDDVNFLKEGLHTGDTWYSSTWTGHISLGIQIMSLRFHLTCLDAEAVLTINNQSFRHVYKVELIPEMAEQGQPLVPTGEVITSYYAKGVGLIYAERFNTVLTHGQLRIRNWVVN